MKHLRKTVYCNHSVSFSCGVFGGGGGGGDDDDDDDRNTQIVGTWWPGRLNFLRLGLIFSAQSL